MGVVASRSSRDETYPDHAVLADTSVDTQRSCATRSRPYGTQRDAARSGTGPTRRDQVGGDCDRCWPHRGSKPRISHWPHEGSTILTRSTPLRQLARHTQRFGLARKWRESLRLSSRRHCVAEGVPEVDRPLPPVRSICRSTRIGPPASRGSFSMSARRSVRRAHRSTTESPYSRRPSRSRGQSDLHVPAVRVPPDTFPGAV